MARRRADRAPRALSRAGDTWAVPRSPRAAIVLVAAAVGALLAGGSAAPASSSHRAVVIRGYAYASRCPRAGYEDDVVDRWGMYMCNCTSYVAWALAANGKRTDWFIPGSMNAWNWPNVARRQHLPVRAKPRISSVAVWPKLARPFGHVAYVSGLEPDGGIDVAEYNLPQAAGGARYVFDTRRDVSARGAVFIYVPARRGR